MTTNSPNQSQTNGSSGADEHIDYLSEFKLGAGGYSHTQRISGPSRLVGDFLDSDNRDLLRWGVFVLTFVPITTTLIAKLPEIITALADALD